MRHLIAAVVAVFAAVASYQSNVTRSGDQYPGWELDVAIAVSINVAVVYLVAFIWSKLRKPKTMASSSKGSTNAQSTNMPTVTTQRPPSPKPTMTDKVQQQPPVSLAFSDASKFVERNSQRFTDVHQQAVAKASSEFKNRTITKGTPFVWAFAHSNRPLLVAYEQKLFQFGASSMALWTNHSGRGLRFAVDRFGATSFEIDGIVFRNVEPRANAERITSVLNIEQDDSILGDNHESRLKVSEDLIRHRDTFEEQMLARGIAFYWEEGNQLVVMTIHRDLVERLIDDFLSSSTEADDSAETTVPPNSIDSRLRKLQKLHDDGLITNDELLARRKEILREI